MSIKTLVKSILTNIPKTRNSDYWLWLEVIKRVLDEKGDLYTLRNWSVESFLTYGFNTVPHFETVSRARRKVQAQYPELRGCTEVQEAREVLEEEYREFARSDV